MLNRHPAWIVLLASLVYLGTVIWQHFDKPVPTVATPEKQPAASLFVLPTASINCDKIPHSTPGLRPELLGPIVSSNKHSMTLKTQEGNQTIGLTSNTLIYTAGEMKPPEKYAAEMAEFGQIMRTCQDEQRVYFAPDNFEHVPLTTAALKPRWGAKILLQDNDGPARFAASMLLLPPLSTKP
jgi:hypothetical protein